MIRGTSILQWLRFRVLNFNLKNNPLAQLPSLAPHHITTLLQTTDLRSLHPPPKEALPLPTRSAASRCPNQSVATTEGDKIGFDGGGCLVGTALQLSKTVLKSKRIFVQRNESPSFWLGIVNRRRL